MKINLFERALGTFFFTGYFPFASGTFTSAFAIAVYLIPGFETPVLMMALISIFAVYGITLGGKFEKIHGKDPGIFTLDEVVGTWISLLLIPKTIVAIAIVFFIWRLLDIVKPFPARTFENKLKGGWGIMLDDIVSGIYSLIVAHIIIFFIDKF